ncbi:MAG: hypothetical protein U0Z44_02790 [Kouleothrix sp.]
MGSLEAADAGHGCAGAIRHAGDIDAAALIAQARLEGWQRLGRIGEAQDVGAPGGGRDQPEDQQQHCKQQRRRLGLLAGGHGLFNRVAPDLFADDLGDALILEALLGQLFVHGLLDGLLDQGAALGLGFLIEAPAGLANSFAQIDIADRFVAHGASTDMSRRNS